ncbi:multidrug effflux MFS transporter [Celeribacter arenosi]|uniref:Multidrug effflux MFS transporter n=1 Tax=Celeribacter arenosi TaxID=792649 RepID=A0ABP7KFD1_9RHOB
MPRRLSQSEFIALLAFLFAAVAFSIDSMLPALPQIAQELTAQDINRAQLVLTSFVLGLGIGTLFTGPLSDAWGRKAVITGGLALYAVAAWYAAHAPTLEGMLAARVVQGMGAAAPRIVGLAMVRDLYKGREMARITSFVMMIFILVPAVAPALGALVISGFGWRGVFYSFIIFAIVNSVWLNIRQEETLSRENRRPLRFATLWNGVKETLSNPTVRIYITVLTLGFAQMFALISTTQQIYADVFDKGDVFTIWFAATALLSGTGTVLNAVMVMRFGMRRIAIAAYGAQTIISGLILAGTLAGVIPPVLAFPVFFFWSVSIFFMAGVTFGNLTALALEPLGHIAGLASSVVGAISTILAAFIAAPIGLMFDGTIVPLLAGALICSAIAFMLMRRTVEPEAEPSAH